MNMPPDQARIINTVISGLLPVRGQASCAAQILQTIVDFIDGRFNEAAARTKVEEELQATELPVNSERIELCVETASRLAVGYRDWMRGQDPGAPQDFPAWELAKVYSGAEPVNWTEMWRQHEGQLSPGGRMIARKDDAIWQALSAFGLPFPPFGLGSGMGWREISRKEAIELSVISKDQVPGQQERGRNDTAARSAPVILDFSDTFERRVAFYFSPEGHRERLEAALIQASSAELLGLAEKRRRPGTEFAGEVAVEIIALLKRALQRGFGEDFQPQDKVYGMLVEAYNQIGQSEKAAAYRFEHLDFLKAWIEKGIPMDRNQRSIACGKVAKIYEDLGQPERAAVFRRLQLESADGFALLYDAREQLMRLGRQIDPEMGANLLDMLTKAAAQIPQDYPEHHAEIYRATGEILEALGDSAQAIEYYEYAMQKSREASVKRRPVARKSAS